MAQVFELEGPSSGLLQPASKREMLAALLAVLRDTSWARAVGCPAEPALMTPISCATALQRTSLASEVCSRAFTSHIPANLQLAVPLRMWLCPRSEDYKPQIRFLS